MEMSALNRQVQQATLYGLVVALCGSVLINASALQANTLDGFSSAAPVSPPVDSELAPMPVTAQARPGMTPGEAQARSKRPYQLAFEPHPDQAIHNEPYIARLPGYTVSLANAIAAIQYPTAGATSVMSPDLLRISPVGAQLNAAPKVLTGRKLPSVSHVYLGKDSDNWRQNLPNFEEITYTDVYPGIDLRFYGREGLLEYDYIVHPGADPGSIRVRMDGVSTIDINAGGDLELLLAQGTTAIQSAPVVYQEGQDGRESVAGQYLLTAATEFGFHIDGYDAERTLVIDPALGYSTLLGGAEIDEAHDVVVDDLTGYVYTIGSTQSSDFPDASGSPQGQDVFVRADDIYGNRMWTTLIGGYVSDDGIGIVLASDGTLGITGTTDSFDFPIVNGAISVFGGGKDAFLARLDPNGSINYSTFAATSPSPEFATDIAVADDGALYITGSSYDSFVVELLADGSLRTQYFSASGSILPTAVEVVDNVLWVVGETSAEDFPVTNNSTHQGGGSDIFLYTRDLSTSQTYATYIGGSGLDNGAALAARSDGSVWLIGFTSSPDMPVTDNSAHTGGYSVYIEHRTSPSEAAYSTYLGGTGLDVAKSADVGWDDSIWITGNTTSSDFPTTGDAHDRELGGVRDGFVANVQSDNGLLYGTFFGGIEEDFGHGISVNRRQWLTAHVVGYTDSDLDFPIRNGRYGGGNRDAFQMTFWPHYWPLIVYPEAESTLSGASVEFRWYADGATDATDWQIYAGSSFGASDYHDSGLLGTDTRYTLDGLPTDGSTLHIRLWFTIEGVQHFRDESYTTGMAFATRPPTPGSELVED